MQKKIVVCKSERISAGTEESRAGHVLIVGVPAAGIETYGDILSAKAPFDTNNE